MPIIVRKKNKKPCIQREDENDTATASVLSLASSNHQNSSNDDHGADNGMIRNLKTKKVITVEVDSAILNISKGVQQIILRRQHKNSCNEHIIHHGNKIQRKLRLHILPHIKHCMITLQQQLNALQVGLYCFQSKLLPAIHDSIRTYISKILLHQSTKPRPNDNKSVVLIQKYRHDLVDAIQHLFYWLLHLHDGYILTVSGECRHRVDQKIAQESKYSSQLNQTTCQRSNPHSDMTTTIVVAAATTTTTPYTTTTESSSQLYSKEHIYSGTSWDEYMDGANGLRIRLLQAIAQLKYGNGVGGTNKDTGESLWEDWTYEMTRPGFALENIITQIETQMLFIQTQFTNLTGKHITNTIQSAFKIPNRTIHTSITLNWCDKMESLRISSSIFVDADGSLSQNQTVQFERYANDFQIHTMMKSGILPLQFTTSNHWWNDGGMNFCTKIHMEKLARDSHVSNHNPNQKKRRRIIVGMEDESDSDSDMNSRRENYDQGAFETAVPMNSSVMTGGLVVKMMDKKKSNAEMISNESSVTQNNCSVNDIKLQYGINVQDREAAFDGLQAEEDGTAREAYIVDHTPTDELLATNEDILGSMQDEIEHVERRVKHAKRSLMRILDSAVNVNHEEKTHFELNTIDSEIWNAREVFREALMSAGDVLLWCIDRTTPDQMDDVKPSLSPARILNKAIQYFTSARGLVVNQQKLHERMNLDVATIKNCNDDEYDTFCFFRRNLLLLKGQAQVNIGIGYFELAIHCYPNERDSMRKNHFQTACEELNNAISIAQTMHSQAIEDIARSASVSASVLLDRIQSQQLESLALRWKATTLWHLYKKPESIHTFELGSSAVDDVLISAIWIELQGLNSSVSIEDQNLMVDAVVESRIECFYGWTTLADLASRSLERATVTSIRESARTTSFYDAIMEYVVQGLTNAAKISQTLYTELHQSMFPEKYDELCKQGRLFSSDDLVQSLSEIQEWWIRRQRIADGLPTKALNATDVENARIPRNDLFSNGKEGWDALPTQKFVLQPLTRRSKYNLGGGTGGTWQSRNKCNPTINDTENLIDEGQQCLNQRVSTKSHQPNHQYRKWREDMITDPISGRLVSKLVYPSIAPKMPPHIEAIFARKRSTK